MAGSGTAHLRQSDDVLLRAENLVVEFPVGSTGLKVHAVSDVSLDIKAGETLGLVGESGCGKSTTGRALIQMPQPTSGEVLFEGEDLTKLSGSDLRAVRPQMQMIFQDPISSLNPRRRVYDIVAEPLRIWKRGTKDEQRTVVNETLEAVGIPPDTANRRPHQFSGGQCQRISIARAVVLDPKIIICDEPVSALDVSVQAQILNLLQDMKTRYGLTLVFIAHDLAVVKNVSDRVAVMYLGKLCEVAPPDDLYAQPAHPYTAALLSSIPVADPTIRPTEEATLGGEIPSPVAPPSGCRFRTRCDRAQDMCAQVEPKMRQIGLGHYVACHFPLDADEKPAAAKLAEKAITSPGLTHAPDRARTRLDPEVRREQIIDATEVVLADHEPGEITLEQVAEAAGVSRGLVYNYFGDKAGLLAAVYLRSLDCLVDALDTPLRTDDPAEQRLRAVVEVYLRFAAENPIGWKLVGTSEATEHPAVRSARREHLERISTSWGETPEARVLGRGILGFLEAATIEWIDESDLDVERAADLIHAQLWSGLGLSTTRQQYHAATLR